MTDPTTQVEPPPPMPRDEVADLAKVGRLVAHHYAEALRLGDGMNDEAARRRHGNSQFHSLEWTQARWHLNQAQALEGLARYDLPAALVIVREAAMRGLTTPT